MTSELAISLIFDAVLNITLVVAILIGPGMVVGLLVSIFQAATQINEQTLSFLPRLMVMLITLMWAGPWLVRQWLEFTETLVHNIPFVIG